MLEDQIISVVMLRMVAMAPGPHISGNASGTNAILPASPAPPGGMIDPLPEDAEKSWKPICIKIMPPTIRTMLKGTPKSRSIKVPKSKKKNNACLARHRAMFVQVFAVEKFQENRQSLERIDDGQQRRERADEQSEFLPHVTAPNECLNSFRSLEMLMPKRRRNCKQEPRWHHHKLKQAGARILCLLHHHRDDAFRIEGLPTLIEMTSLGEGGCDLA